LSCNFYFKYDSGLITEQDFKEHMKICNVCRTKYEQDEKLINLSSSLKQPVPDTNLWSRIEENLVTESQRSDKKHFWLNNYRNLFFRVAAILIIGIGVAFYFLMKNDVPAKGILEARALENVNKTELDYEHAIDNLQQVASMELGKFDLNLQLLYRDKLETINRQIIACKEALEVNPANAHIRRYLFMALQDKKETLKEIISTQPDKNKKDS
jgi:hypothetical protein